MKWWEPLSFFPTLQYINSLYTCFSFFPWSDVGSLIWNINSVSLCCLIYWVFPAFCYSLPSLIITILGLHSVTTTVIKLITNSLFSLRNVPKFLQNLYRLNTPLFVDNFNYPLLGRLIYGICVLAMFVVFRFFKVTIRKLALSNYYWSTFLMKKHN